MSKKKLYLLTTGDRATWYCGGVVVCAASKEEARGSHPEGDPGLTCDVVGRHRLDDRGNRVVVPYRGPHKSEITVEHIGTASADLPVGVVLSSYEA
jgi:hypothetical protein